MERLSKYLARFSSFSRRKSEEIIRQGRVKVNNIIVLEPQHGILDGIDSVTLDGQALDTNVVLINIALYKPVGYISDLQDVRNRKIARDLMKVKTKVFPVGRLDYNSEGLIIFTNDGEFANIVMHPRYGIKKRYLVKFKGVLKKEEIAAMHDGIIIEGDIYKINSVQYVNSSIRNAWYSVVIDEGKNRMIRKIGNAIGHPVLKLKRTMIGNLRLGDLKPGEYRFFDKKELFGDRL